MEARRAGALRLLALVLAGGALVAAAAGTDVTFGVGETGPATPAAVTSGPGQAAYLTEAVLACPGVVEESGQGEGEQDLAAETRVRVAGAPREVIGADSSPTGAPELELALVGADGVADVPSDVEGHLATSLGPGSWGMVRGAGELAPGVVASQLSLAPDPGARGWALTPCSVPSDVVHLVGGGDGAGRVELVVVTNPSTDPVTVDLEVFGEDGTVPTVGGSGLVVPPQGRLVQRLDALAASARHPVVRVVAQGGPVTAHLVDRHRTGTTDLGREFAAAAATPATELVVPALPGHVVGEQTITLRLFAPEDEAVVELRALTEEGARIPGPAVVRVPAGSTIDVELDGLPGGPGALRLRSDAPVTAGALLQVAPASDEPIMVGRTPAVDEATSTAGPDEATTTAGPDDATTTAGPDDAATTAGPDAAATTAGPDAAATTAGPDAAATTAGADAIPQAEPVLHPAGESAWVAAVPLSRVPLGMALPDLTDLPGVAAPDAEQPPEPVAALAVSAVDATTAMVLWLDDRGRVRSEELTLANDTTHVLEVPGGTVALWVLPAEDAGIAAALHLGHQDLVGPYLTAATLPQVPWTRAVPAVVPVLP